MYYTCRFRLMWLVIAALLIALPAAAQEEVGYLDLTEVRANPLRYKKFIPDSRCNGMGDGGWATSVGCPPNAYRFKLSVLSVDTSELSAKAAAFVLLRLQNVGQAAASVPWATDPDQIELPDVDGKFSFAKAELTATIAQEGSTTRFLIPARLYGAKGASGTLKVIRPGDYVELRVGAVLNCTAAMPDCRSLKAGPGRLSIEWRETDNQVTYQQCGTFGSTSTTRGLTSNSTVMSIVRSWSGVAR